MLIEMVYVFFAAKFAATHKQLISAGIKIALREMKWKKQNSQGSRIAVNNHTTTQSCDK